MITDLAAFSGMEGESMTRGHGWLFLDIGRRLERSIGMTRLVRTAIEASPSHVAILEPLLEVADSSMTYRRRYFAEAQLPPVLDLLLADGTNPRALRFQLDTMSVLLRISRGIRGRHRRRARNGLSRTRSTRSAPQTSMRSVSQGLIWPSIE
jgi:uncharacterized alpha-E superfamily protein